MPENPNVQDHYAILMLTCSKEDRKILTEKDIKLAYRRALLSHHPDKSNLTQVSNSKHSIDQITIAYRTLIDPVARSEYDRLLALKPSTPAAFTISQTLHPGLETVDLDDLSSDDQQGFWYRSCRCGKERGYAVSEEELESSIECGEVLTGCQGCSLWLRVIFAVAEEE